MVPRRWLGPAGARVAGGRLGVRLALAPTRLTTLTPAARSAHRPERPAAIGARGLSTDAAGDASTSGSSHSASSLAADDPRLGPRESMDYDVVIVGGGPAGLAAAIRLKKQAAASGQEVTVCLVEKGAEVGSHILSGNVFDPKALDELWPEWRQDPECPIKVPVKEDKVFFLTSKLAIPMPVPPSLHNEGNYIISLSQLTRWLATKAEGLGVDLFPGFAASELLYSSSGAVCGIATKDVGISKDGHPKDTFARGMELRGAQTLLAEGTRGSLSEAAMAKFHLREGVDPQTYGLGVKEIWEVAPENFRPGRVQHTLGWPSPSDTWSGSFVYHFDDNKVLVGVVIGLDYSNTYISPYQEMQQFKRHPMMQQMLAGGKCLEYGARVINEGGLQSIPKLTFPGGALIGCSAGFLNVPRVKGSHTAMKSGMVAADAIIDEINKAREGGAKEATPSETLAAKEVTSYSTAIRASWIHSELYAVRNFHPSFHRFGGLYGFLAYSALQAFVFRGREPWTFRNDQQDWQRTRPAADCEPIEYPKPDGVLTFDLLTNLQRSAVKHNEDQPSHLKVRHGMHRVPIDVSWAKFQSPETRFCPAKVYEVIPAGPPEGAAVGTGITSAAVPMKLQINKSNCIHCKTCAIKTPELYIDWTVPEGGGGPNYQGM